MVTGYKSAATDAEYDRRQAIYVENMYGKHGLGRVSSRPSFDEIYADRFRPSQIPAGFLKAAGQTVNGIGKTITQGAAYLSKFDPEFSEETRGDAIAAGRAAGKSWDKTIGTVVDPSLLAYSNDSQRYAGAYFDIGSAVIGGGLFAESKTIYEGGLFAGATNSGLGKITGNYSAIEPGPLANNLAETFSGGRYSTVVLGNDTVLYRSGTADQPLGQFFSLEQPTSVLQARIDKAVLPVWPGS